MREYHKDLILAFLIPFILGFIALNLSFLFSRFIPGDPVLAYLPEGPINWTLYEQLSEQLGYNDPLILQYFRYMLNMISGNWGISFSLARGFPVSEFIALRMPRTIDILSIPLIISIGLGVFIGKLSVRKRSNELGNRLTQIPCLFLLTIPISIIGMFFQFLFRDGLLPVTGFKTPAYDDPPFITGFRIIDSLLSGQWFLIPDYLLHLILPWLTLTIAMTPLIILLVRTYFLNKSSQKSLFLKHPITLNMVIVAFGFGMVMTNAILADITFGMAGFGGLLMDAVFNMDYWVINACFYIIPIAFIVVIFCSNLLLTLYYFIKENRSHNLHEQDSFRVEQNQILGGEVNE